MEMDDYVSPNKNRGKIPSYPVYRRQLLLFSVHGHRVDGINSQDAFRRIVDVVDLGDAGAFRG